MISDKRQNWLVINFPYLLACILVKFFFSPKWIITLLDAHSISVSQRIISDKRPHWLVLILLCAPSDMKEKSWFSARNFYVKIEISGDNTGNQSTVHRF